MPNLLFRCLRKGAEILRSNPWIKKYIYDPFRGAIRKRWLTIEYMLYYAERNKKTQSMVPSVSNYQSPYIFKIGVLRDPFFNHEPYCVSCSDLQVKYKTIDIFASDWVEQVNESGCDAFVAWPSESIQEWKRLCDDRLRFLSKEMGKILYPDCDALWLYGSKERQRDWLEINHFPHPKTWVFYKKEEGFAFLSTAKFPFVAKVDIGACAHGVSIIRSKKEGTRLMERVFKSGAQGSYSDKQTYQWRHILLQEHVGDVREWRIIRIGNSFFGYEKVKHGDFHSGTGLAVWADPPKDALELLYQITERGKFRSMSMDVFQKLNGELLVNELQSVFGAYDTAQMYVNGVPGRYTRVNGEYVFEEGRFCRNTCCNLRVEDLLHILKERQKCTQKEEKS
jgi:hypothetical protein